MTNMMNNHFENERYMSTASTVSGFHSHAIQSPDPVCMFYFAHPFGGISTPGSTSYSIDPFAGMPSAEKISNCKNENKQQQQHLNNFIPWPRQTLQTNDTLAPIIETLRERIGQNISDFETILRTLRALWYAPSNNISDVQYLRNYYSFIQRQKQLNEHNFNYIANWQEKSNQSNTLTQTGTKMANVNFKSVNLMDQTDMSHKKYRKPHTGLLRRRHSLPEIIMRKHVLATQKQLFSELKVSATATAPSPPAREKVPPSFESSDQLRATSTSTLSSSLASSSSSIIMANSFKSTGSDSNLNRFCPSSDSMRQQLLRRLWHKEYRRLDRSGSLSPPMRRSLRSKRAFKIFDNSPEVCLECKKLEETQFNRSVPNITMEQTKHITSIANENVSSTISMTQHRKSYIVENEISKSSSIVTDPSISEDAKISIDNSSENDVRSGQSLIDMNTTSDSTTSSVLTEINGNMLVGDDSNSDKCPQPSANSNSFLIELDGDRINVTTISDRTIEDSTDFSSTPQQNQPNNSTMNQSDQNSDDYLNGNFIEVNEPANNIQKMIDMNSSVRNVENDSVVRLNTSESIDQTTIDMIISQILVESLNNIIVVQGKTKENDSTNRTNNIELSSSQTQTEDNVSTASSPPLPVAHGIYFPHYLSTEMLSEYSTKFSNNSSAMELLPSNLVISVISGSSYPFDGGEMVVHRLADMPRTESMEVQPSSAHSKHIEDENGNLEIPNAQKTENVEDDDVESLVDSLDNPDEIHKIDPDLDTEESTEKIAVDKSQAFFIPIENSELIDKVNPGTADRESNAGLETVIAKSLPEHLRERMEKRQMKITQRKEAEMKLRQEKLQSLIKRHEDIKKGTNSSNKADIPSFEVIVEKSHSCTVKKVVDPIQKPNTQKKSTNKQLRSGIGSLESYTVDGKGNLQFTESRAKVNGNKKTMNLASGSAPVAKHVAIKKIITTKPIVPARKKLDNHNVQPIKVVEKRMKTIKSVAHNNRTKEISKKQKDVQKITLIHQSPADMVTPDGDGGPRRMYQKTEICEGTKCIEILEIVECSNSSPDNIDPSQSTTISSTSPTPSLSYLTRQPNLLIEKFSSKRMSKIPIPVSIKQKPKNRNFSNGNQKRLLKAQIRDTAQIENNVSNSKVDQMLADLLIEALNHSTDIGIEFIKTPQNLPTQSMIKVNNSRRMNLSTRRTSNVIIGSTFGGNRNRSAHNSAKYQQMFESIPEEKVSSLSTESPNEENTSSKNKKDAKNKNNESIDKSNGEKEPRYKVASGKAAIESDPDKLAETWFGCFGRTHIDSPVLDEELQGNQSLNSFSQENNSKYINDETAGSHDVSIVSTKSSIIPTETEAEAGRAETAETNSILPLIDETFETSVSGVAGSDTSHKEFKQENAKCSTGVPSDVSCTECHNIGNDLRNHPENIKNETVKWKANESESFEETDKLAVDKIDLKRQQNSGSTNMHNEHAEDAGRVSNIDKYNMVEKFDLSPITVCSRALHSELRSMLSTSSLESSRINDGTSFIILHDTNDNTSHFLPNITDTTSDHTTIRNGFNQMDHNNCGGITFNRPCDDCCFCNPNLHQSQKLGTMHSSKKCNFCSSHRQSTAQTSPEHSSKFQKNSTATTNNETNASNRSSTPATATERKYESKYRSNHTHVRTHSRDSDVINTHCTKTTNRLVRKTIRNRNDDILNGNIDKSRFVHKNDESGNERKHEQDELNESGNKDSTKKKSSIPKLPPATQNDWNNFEMSSSGSSVHSTGSSNESRIRKNSKSVPNLPRTDRWQYFDSNGNTKIKMRTKSRYQEFYANDVEEKPMGTSSESKSKPTGWTVTVAGTYNDDMAPDVEMHLSFPKRSVIQNKKFDLLQNVEHSQVVLNEERCSYSASGDDALDVKEANRRLAILPPSQSIKFNPKKSLKKHLFENEIAHQEHQSDSLNSQRKMNNDSNGNLKTYTQHSSNTTRKFPDVNNRYLNSQAIVAKQTAKKTIKRSEYSVSLATSATTTTRSVSNLANGNRAMSYHAFNMNSYTRNRNPNKKRSYSHREHSIEIGQLPYRISAMPSPERLLFYTPSTLDLDNETVSNGNSRENLSVFGNAIAPERKPPVPTMSERDVTRRHNACFTRTRSIFS